MRNEASNECAVGSEEEDRVQSHEDGGEDAGHDRLPCDADVGPNRGEEEVQGCDERGGEGAAVDVLLLQKAGEDDG